MLKPTHVITTMTFSTTILTITHQVTNYHFSIPILCGSYLGSFLPDIDNPHSKINHRLPIIGHYLAHHHRGITHSGIAILCLFAIVYLTTLIQIPILTNYLIGLSFGYLIHLIEDNFSVQGVLWCYPFTKFQISQNGYGHYKKRRFHHYFYYTGSSKETIIRWCTYPLFLTSLYFLIQQIPH